MSKLLADRRIYRDPVGLLPTCSSDQDDSAVLRRHGCGCLVVAAVAVVQARRRLATGCPITSLPDPIPTRQTFFSIPFKVPPTADASQAPVEVRLYASADAGGSWTLAEKVDPKKTSFSYRAPRDGEYWFAIRTVDRQGHIRPDHSSGPELRVIVDTAATPFGACRLNAAGRWPDRASIGFAVIRCSSPTARKPSNAKSAGDPTWRLVGINGRRVKRGAARITAKRRFALNGNGPDYVAGGDQRSGWKSSENANLGSRRRHASGRRRRHRAELRPRSRFRLDATVDFDTNRWSSAQ